MYSLYSLWNPTQFFWGGWNNVYHYKHPYESNQDFSGGRLRILRPTAKTADEKSIDYYFDFRLTWLG